VIFPALIYDDDQIFVKMTPDEFSTMVQNYVDNGKSVKEAIDEIVLELKRRSLTT
jgi:hypothetical protein